MALERDMVLNAKGNHQGSTSMFDVMMSFDLRFDMFRDDPLCVTFIFATGVYWDWLKFDRILFLKRGALDRYIDITIKDRCISVYNTMIHRIDPGPRLGG